MCGIHAVISASAPSELSENLKRCLCNRGPDYMHTHATRLSTRDEDAPTTHLVFTSTVLALRGDHIARQPFVDPESGSVFCWNGEAWKIRNHDVAGNDGEVLAGLLNDAIRCSPCEREQAVLKVLRAIEGPFAFVLFDKPSNRVYYGRDRLGRRSLLVQLDSQQLVLSSVADSLDPSWKEVEADGVYVVDLESAKPKTGSNEPFTTPTRREWLEGHDALDFVSALLQPGLCLLSMFGTGNRLTSLGLCHWKVQRLDSEQTSTSDSWLVVSQGPLPAIDRVAQTACFECARATLYR